VKILIYPLAKDAPCKENFRLQQASRQTVEASINLLYPDKFRVVGFYCEI